MLKFYNELKRRKVLTTLGVYGAVALIIINLATSVFPYINLPPWTITFVIILVILGFPITFFLSWTYDLNPDAVTKDKRARENLESDKNSIKIILPITGFLTLIGGSFWIWYSLVNISTGSEVDFQMGIKKSIAILGFENNTGNKDGDFFCAALTELVHVSLSKLGRLDVKSRLSSKKIKEGIISTDDLYGNLDYFVEGALSQIADNKHINISLINAKNQNTKWSGQYTFSENEILQYQDTILNNIVQNLNIDFDPVVLQNQKERYKNSESFQLIGEGIYHFDNANYKNALVSFNDVLNIDSRNISAQFHKANTLSKLERYDDATKIYSDLLKESISSDYINWEWKLPQYKNTYSTIFRSCITCGFSNKPSVLFNNYNIWSDENQENVLLLLRGIDESRLIQLNIKTQKIIWSEPVPDAIVGYPIIINDLILLTSNHLNLGESAIFAYDKNTGMQQFIHEYPRNKNRFVTLQILEEYNKVSQDSLSILVYKRTSGVQKVTAYNDSLLRREISLLDNKGNELWATPIGITSLSGAKVNVVKRGSEKFIIVCGDKDIYKINNQTGVVIWHKHFPKANYLGHWGDYIVDMPWEIENGIISLWDPIKETKLWSYSPPSKIKASTINPWEIEIDDGFDPVAMISLDNGVLTALNLDLGWLNWNPERWSHNVGSHGVPKIHKGRVFYLSENALLTFNRRSGEKINKIKLDHTEHWFLTDTTLNPQILINEKFIMGIDPLNGDQLWKIKELRKDNNTQIKLFNKNLLVARPMESDSIVLLNNYRRDDGNLIWSKVFDVADRMVKWQDIPISAVDGAFDYAYDRNDLDLSLINFNDKAYLILRDAIIKIDLSADQTISNIEPEDVRLGLARAFSGLNSFDKSEFQYRSVIEKYDQMSQEAHWELANLYSVKNKKKDAVSSLLKYYDLVLPDSKEAGQTLQKLKEITPLRWSQNIFSNNGDYLFVDNNKIFRINKSHVEIYRLSSGALLNKIPLDKNTDRVLAASLQDNLYLITRIMHTNQWAAADTIDNVSRSKYETINLMSFNKDTGVLLYNKILDLSSLPVGKLTVDNKFIYFETSSTNYSWLYSYDKGNANKMWQYRYDRQEFNLYNNDLEAVSYMDKVFFPLNDKIIYLDREKGQFLGEYIFEDIEEITTFNKHGLNENIMTFIIEDFDFELLTINLDSGKLIDRQVSEYERPSIELNYKNQIFDINNFDQRLTAYSFSNGENKVSFDWEKNYNNSISLIGMDNGLLYLADKVDNSIFSIDADSGSLVKKHLPLLWPALKLRIYNNYVIVQSDGHLYVIKNSL